jgi:hypothetical protein
VHRNGELSCSSGREQTCFHSTRMEADIGTYRARIGTFKVSSVKKTAATQEVMEGNQCWFVGLVIMVLLVVGVWT